MMSLHTTLLHVIDIEYKFDFGWSELEGIADRGTFDLDKHMEC